MKTAVVFWSGTGNTEILANKIAEGIKAAGGDADVLGSSSFSASDVEKYGAFAFGCPAMGAENLEEDEFEPMFTSVEALLKGKKVVLFGSYGWGDGEWMRSWKERCENDGAAVLDTLIANGEPDDEALEAALNLGKSVAC